MVDFGSGQGLSDFETAGIAGYSEDFKKAKTQPWAERCRLGMGTCKQRQALQQGIHKMVYGFKAAVVSEHFIR